MEIGERLKGLLRDENGISAVEYAMLLSLIGAGILVGMLALGSGVSNNINQAAQTLQSGS